MIITGPESDTSARVGSAQLTELNHGPQHIYRRRAELSHGSVKTVEQKTPQKGFKCILTSILKILIDTYFYKKKCPKNVRKRGSKH